MAGQVPDIMMLDYTLIDNDPHLNRDDFYTFLRTSHGSVFGTYETAQELHNRVSLWLIE